MPVRRDPDVDPITQYYIDAATSPSPAEFFATAFGRNPDVDASGGPEDVWSQGGFWVAPTAARIHDIVSTSANDTAAGTGAQSVIVRGLDSNFLELPDETVVTNGTTPVPTSNAYSRINFMFAGPSGTVGSNEGIITATAQTDGTVSAAMPALAGRSLGAIFTIPANKRGALSSVYGSIIKAQATTCEMFLYGRLQGGSWQTAFFFGVDSTGTATFQHVFDPDPILFGGTDVRMQADVSGNNTIVAGGFQLRLFEYQEP